MACREAVCPEENRQGVPIGQECGKTSQGDNLPAMPTVQTGGDRAVDPHHRMFVRGHRSAFGSIGLRSVGLCGEHAEDDLSQLRFGFGGHGENLFDIGRLQGIGETDVGNDREPQHAHSGMDRDEHFGHGRHADHVGPDDPQKAVFRPRFQVRTGHGDVHASVGREILAPRDLQRRRISAGS